MRIEEPIIGFVKYAESYFPFVYKEGILQLIPPTVETWRDERDKIFDEFKEWVRSINEDNWIGVSYICGTTNSGYNIAFHVRNDSSNNNGVVAYQVNYYFVYHKEYLNIDKIQGFSISGREIDYFYEPARVFSMYRNKNGSFPQIEVEHNEKKASKYTYKDTEITVVLDANATFHTKSEIPVTAKSYMDFCFSKPRDLEYLLEVFFHCKKFFYYVCKRTNIQLDDINVYGIRGEKKSVEGIVKICSCGDDAETNEKAAKNVIKYEFLNEKMGNLFQSVADENMYFEHLCPSAEARNSYKMDRVILNFVAFEREYSNLYNLEIERSEEYMQVRDEIIATLEVLKKNHSGKKKKYVNEFLRSFSKAEIKYGDRMNKALRDCEDVLLPFLQYTYSNYTSDTIDEVCERMNKLRNDVVHGNMRLEVEPIHLRDFATLENLLYAMRLKNLGVSKTNIQKAIRELKDYHILIKEEL